MKDMERKIFKSLILAAALVCSAQTVVIAQEYVSEPVTVSKEKVRVNGKICYSHIVREKQTLYSIAKAYEVSVDDIYALNPTLKETGLKKNSIIIIPSKEVAAKADAAKAEASKTEATKTEVLKTEVEKTEEPVIQDGNMRKHIVKWYEDLNVIADKYGVSVEAIMKANNLTGKKLSKRQTLLIPERDVTATTVQEETKEISDNVQMEDNMSTVPSDSTATDTVPEDADTLYTHKNEVTATLILPMKASTDNVSRNNMDFYSGVLLAVKDLAESGISTELNVYDSSDSEHPIAREDLDGSDIIIGPVSSTEIGRLLQSDVNAKMVISPLDPRAESHAYVHKNFIQVPTPQSVLYKDLVDWIGEDTLPGDTLLIITEKGARKTETIEEMTQLADSSGLTFIPFSYSILEGRDITEPLTGLMTATGTNRVLIASDSEAFVNDVVRNLNIMVYNKLNVAVYAPSRIRNFETIEVENLHNTGAHVSLGYLIDYDSQQVKNFLLKYRALYNTEPTQYAFQGYDIATYFINMCSMYGDRWIEKIGSNEKQMLQSAFNMVPAGDGGFINQGVRRVVYRSGWSVTKTK